MTQKYWRTQTVITLLLGTAIAVGMYFWAKGEQKVTQANAQDIYEILSDNVDEVIRQIGMENVDVSLPLDGKGARVLVRVEQGAAAKVPDSIVIDHASGKLEIPLEASESYETYNAQ